MNKPRSSLASYIRDKQPPASEPESTSNTDSPEASAKKPKKPQPKGYVVRLPVTAWKQLKFLAIEQECTMHKLMLEAVNDLFKKYGKPPVA